MSKTDIFGRTQEEAVALFEKVSPSISYGISLVRGVWVFRYEVSPDAYRQGRGAWKNDVGYTALGRDGEHHDSFALGTRKLAIDKALAS